VSNKFGWQKAATRDAARRAAGPNPYPTRRHQSRKSSKRKTIKQRRPSLFHRHQCPECQSLQVITVKPLKRPPYYECGRCHWSSSIEPSAVLCEWISAKSFKPLMANGPGATPTACGQQVDTKRIRSAPGFDNGAFAGGLGYRPPSAVPDRTTALGDDAQTREVRD
jgi:hypothetical protein